MLRRETQSRTFLHVSPHLQQPRPNRPPVFKVKGTPSLRFTRTRRVFFCGSDKRHDRKKCSARSAVCYKCQKTGHFTKVCRSSSSAATTGTSACISSPALCSVQGAPECLSFAVTTVILWKRCLSALNDPGYSLSFVNEETAKTLHLPIYPPSHTVSIAVGSLKGSILGHCSTKITLNCTVHENVQLKVMRNLCCDVLLGQDFQRQHQRVVFTYDGTRPELVISSLPPETCAVTAATVECPSLFHDLTPNCRPVAVLSRQYNVHDSAFIESEVKKLYEQGIIRSSNSPWQAQPIVVTNKETGTKRLCIDYSQTINLFTVLDAYPLQKIDEIVRKLARCSFLHLRP